MVGQLASLLTTLCIRKNIGKHSINAKLKKKKRKKKGYK
jgi:hypothetical protein